MLTVFAAFTKTTGVPATALTLTDIDLYLTSVAIDDAEETVIWDGTQNPSAEIDDMGLYIKQYSSEDLTANHYAAAANYTGATTLDSDWVTGVLSAGDLSDAAITEIWSRTTRTLSSTGATITAAASGGTLTITRGDTWSAALTSLGSIASRKKLWMTIKRNKNDADSAALVQIEETAGLVYFKGAAGTSANGSITVDDEDDGDITVVLVASDTASLTEITGAYGDVQWVDANDAVWTLQTYSVDVDLDVTRATS